MKLFCLLLIITTTGLMGQELKKNGFVAISGGFNRPMGQEEFKNTYKTGFGFNASIDGIISEYISLGGEFTYGTNSPDIAGMVKFLGLPGWVVLDAEIDGGDVSIFALNPFIRFILTPKSKVSLSFLSGVGFYHLGVTGGTMRRLSDGASQSFSAVTENKIGLNIGSRLDAPISSKLKIIFLLKYHIMFTENESTKFLIANFGIGIPF